jgi:hypothetical protein
MPSRPSYFHRLSSAIGELKRLETPWVDRRAIEELLSVSKAGAWRVMRRCGAEDGPGGALVCRREGLIAALEALETTGEWRQEARRRARVETYLTEIAEFARSRKTKIADGGKASELISSRFRKLPAGVELTPRRLIVEFTGAQDFLEKVGAVIFALQNDFDAMRDFIDGRR